MKTYKAHEVWSAVLGWWDDVIPDAVRRFGQHGAAEAAEWRRYEYSDEEVEELMSALSLDALAPSHRTRIKRTVVGAILETLDEHQCGLYDLEVQVNLDHLFSDRHPEWTRILMRELSGRRVCVWVAPPPTTD